MTQRLEFWVPGRPITWKRTAHFKGRKITTAAQREYQRFIAALAVAAMPKGWPLDMRYRLELDVVQPDRHAADLSNFTKNVEDALNTVAYLDDARIDELVIKRLEPNKATPGMRVVITVLE